MPETRDQRIFITGATGLLGSFVARVLYTNGYHNLVALKRPTSDTAMVADIADRISWVEGDVREVPVLEDGMQGTDYVVHCAAIISYTRRRDAEMHAINVDGTANMINAAIRCGVKRFVHISSIAANTRMGGDQQIDESTEWNRTRYNTEYGYTKHLGEMEAHRGQAEGLDVLILRPSVVLGGGQWNSGSSLMFRKVWDGVRIYPSGVTGYVDARDVANFICLDLVARHDQTTYLLNARNISYREILEHIAGLLDKKAPSILLRPWLAETGWRLLAPLAGLTRHKPILTRDMSRTTQCRMYFDNSRSRTVTGFAYTPLEDTLCDICHYLREVQTKKNDGMPMPLKRRSSR